MPNPIRWTHEEHETTLEGHSGYGKVRFAEIPWSHATSKPFGKVKPGEVGGVSSRMPNQDVRFGRNARSQPVRKLGEIKPVVPTRKVGPEVLICAGATKFDELEHAAQVIEKTIKIQARLEKAFAKAIKVRAEAERVEVKKKKPVKPIGKIKPKPDYVMKLPEFLSREPRTEVGQCVPRENVKAEPYVKPSQGGRAGRVERWGE